MIPASISASSSRSFAMKRTMLGICAGVFKDPRCGIGAKNGESVSTRSWECGTSFTASRKSGAFLNVTVPAKERM